MSGCLSHLRATNLLQSTLGTPAKPPFLLALRWGTRILLDARSFYSSDRPIRALDCVGNTTESNLLLLPLMRECPQPSAQDLFWNMRAGSSVTGTSASPTSCSNSAVSPSQNSVGRSDVQTEGKSQCLLIMSAGLFFPLMWVKRRIPAAIPSRTR